jgi:hypothetical protein
MVKRRFLVEPPNVGTITLHWREGVAENVVEDSVLGKQAMRCTIVSLIPGHIERCKFIFRYGPIGDNFRLVQVIRGHSKDSRKF